MVMNHGIGDDIEDRSDDRSDDREYHAILIYKKNSGGNEFLYEHCPSPERRKCALELLKEQGVKQPARTYAVRGNKYCSRILLELNNGIKQNHSLKSVLGTIDNIMEEYKNEKLHKGKLYKASGC